MAHKRFGTALTCRAPWRTRVPRPQGPPAEREGAELQRWREGGPPRGGERTGPHWAGPGQGLGDRGVAVARGRPGFCVRTELAAALRVGPRGPFHADARSLRLQERVPRGRTGSGAASENIKPLGERHGWAGGGPPGCLLRSVYWSPRNVFQEIQAILLLLKHEAAAKMRKTE